jgi:hypothetical protein
VTPGDPAKVGVSRLNVPTLVLGEQKPDRPIKAGIRIGSDELSAKRRITEDKQNGWAQLYSSLCGEVPCATKTVWPRHHRDFTWIIWGARDIQFWGTAVEAALANGSSFAKRALSK